MNAWDTVRAESLIRRAAVVLVGLLAAACESPAGPPVLTPVAVVELDLEEVVLEIGESVPLRAVVRAADGTVLTGRPVTWTSGTDAVAQVDEAGRVTAISQGTATIRARSEGRQAEARVHVSRPPVGRIEISEDAVVLDPGAVEHLTARVFTPAGRELFDREIVWTTSDPEVVRIDAGRVGGYAGGVAWVTAASEGQTARARITVSGWRERTLQSVGGRPLPAVWQTARVTDEAGIEVTRTIRIRSGRLRLELAAGRYEQELTMERWEDGYVILDGVPAYTGIQVRKETRVFSDFGTAATRSAEIDTLYFASETLTDHTFTGTRTTAGYEVVERINRSGDPVVLEFGAANGG